MSQLDQRVKTKKQILQARTRRLVAHSSCPGAPVDAATLLHAEAFRFSRISNPLAQRMAWGMRLAAAKLEAWGDPASLTQFQKVAPSTLICGSPEE